MERAAGVPATDLADGARWLNGFAHLLATALIAGLARRLSGQARGGWFAGALWGFYPPAVFLAAEPRPETLALLMWLIGVAAALGMAWHAPREPGNRVSRRYAWVFPALAGVAFMLAGAFYAPFWPAALVWPLLAMLLGRESRGVRLFAVAFGVGSVILGLFSLQILWGGSPQPLAGADLYRLARASAITQPWAAPLPAIDLRDDSTATDALENEAVISYESETGQRAPGSAELASYWWSRAVDEIFHWPAHSGLRFIHKFYQFFQEANYGAGPDFARARGEVAPLRFNPLCWTVLLAAGIGGLVLGWRSSGALLLFGLILPTGVGAMLWYPTMEARAPAAAALAILAGALAAGPWPRGWSARAALVFLLFWLACFAWLPRPNDPGALLSALDSRRRAVAWFDLGGKKQALSELLRPGVELSPVEQEMAAGWRFSILLDDLPALPTRKDLEAQLLNNAELAQQSRAAQFRTGAYLWLLGNPDGAVYYWSNRANDDDAWGAAARAALANSGRETPEQARRRAAWSIGGGQPADPSLSPLFNYLRATRARETKKY
jgi:hypothetical protein